MGKTAKKKGDKGAVSATQKKVQKLAERKKKQEEMKQVLQSLKQNQLSQDVLEHLESARDIGQKRKLKDLDKDPKNKKNSVDILDKNKAESGEEDESEEEEEKVEKEADEPVNIFAMSSYENKKVKTEEKSAKPRKSFDEMELEATEKIIREEREANLTINPFKEYKKKLLQGDEPDDDKEEEQKKTENFADIFDEELKQFVQGTSAKFNQPIQRSEADTKAREKLPIFLREFDIIESINNNLITIISGETGSGKSTQVPQFLYERGYSNPEGPNPGKIGITQPRRIAAIALAKRVATEMGSELGQTVAFQVRHESSSLNENNRIKFMTDGILLREMTTDFLLSQYSVIMIDEAHERKVNTDILIGLLSRVVNVRFKLTKEERARKGPDYQGKYDHYPLRLLIMSATLRVKDFTENKFLFPKPVCTINVESRQYPLTVFFSKVTKDDYFQEAIKKCVKIHQKLPAGGILVFMTGEKEIRDFCHVLQERLKKKKKNPEFEEEEETEKDEEGPKSRMKMLDLEGGDLSDNEEEPEYLNENPQEDQAREDLKNAVAVSLKPIVVPLYSKLPLHEQEKIFNNIEENSRLIVVSTNVAETSLTIPGMKYVIDTGKEKKKIYDDKLSISHYKIDWIARASADQRAGRAARVGPGYCYRLYSRAVCGNIMAEYRDPEILNMPLENIVLQLKAVGIRDTMKFPFPTRPDVTNIRFALKNLLRLKAVEPAKNKSQIQVDSQDGSDLLGAAEGLSEDNTNITELGNALSYIPIAPRFAKMILMGRKEGCFVYSVLIAAGLSVEEIFHNENQSLMLAEIMGEGKEGQTGVVKQKFAKKYEKFITGGSDLFTIMNILGEFIKFLYVRVPKLDIIEKLESAINDFALMYTLIAKNLKAIFLNLRQLINIFETLLENDTEKKEMINSFKEYKQPTSAQTNKLQEILTAISINKVARKVKRNQKTLKSDFIYEVIDHDVEVHIHPNSCLKGASPDFLIYDELIFTNKYMMRNVTKISDLKWLLKYDEIPNRKIELLSDPKPFYSRKKGEVIVFASATFGPKNWSIPCFEHHFEEDDYKKYIWFTRSLLDGQVVLGFKDLKPYYGAPVETIKEFNMAPKASRIVNKLKNSGIDTHQKLLAKWKQDIKFLQDEILQWCKPEEKQKIVKSWLNIIKE